MVVMYSAFAMGGPAPDRAVTLAQILDGVGGAGTIIFGIWLALYVDGYELWDGWIIAAIVLWAIATELGRRAQLGFTARPGNGTIADSRAVLMHWLRSVAVVALLVVMIYKPGA